jgi:hypothetical protein
VANIDVAFLLDDPDFVDTAQVIRRSMVDGSNGRGSMTEAPPVGLVGSFQSPTGRDLKRYPEGARADDWVVVYTREPLQPQRDGAPGDVVVWNGARHVVQMVKNWGNFGAGFVVADCQLEGLTL